MINVKVSIYTMARSENICQFLHYEPSYNIRRFLLSNYQKFLTGLTAVRGLLALLDRFCVKN